MIGALLAFGGGSGSTPSPYTLPIAIAFVAAFVIVTPASIWLYNRFDNGVTVASGHSRQGPTYVAELTLVSAPEMALQVIAVAMKATGCTNIALDRQGRTVSARSAFRFRPLYYSLHPTQARYVQHLEATVVSTQPVRVTMKARLESRKWYRCPSSNLVLNDLQDELASHGQLAPPPNNLSSVPLAVPGLTAPRRLPSGRALGAAAIIGPLICVGMVTGAVVIVHNDRSAMSRDLSASQAELDVIQASSRACLGMRTDMTASTNALYAIDSQPPSSALVQQAISIVVAGITSDEVQISELLNLVQGSHDAIITGTGPSLRNDLDQLKVDAASLASNEPSPGFPSALRQYDETLQHIDEQLGLLAPVDATTCGT